MPPTPHTCFFHIYVFLFLKTWFFRVNISLFSRGSTCYPRKHVGLWRSGARRCASMTSSEQSKKRQHFTSTWEPKSGCGSKLKDRRGKPQVLVHVSTFRSGNPFWDRSFEPQPNIDGWVVTLYLAWSPHHLDTWVCLFEATLCQAMNSNWGPEPVDIIVGFYVHQPLLRGSPIETHIR